jgi:hypothetical protein
MKKLAFVLLFGLLTVLSAQAQCPMCKTSLEANRKDQTESVGNGINKGILYLLAMPFVMAASVGGVYWFRLRQR